MKFGKLNLPDLLTNILAIIASMSDAIIHCIIETPKIAVIPILPSHLK